METWKADLRESLVGGGSDERIVDSILAAWDDAAVVCEVEIVGMIDSKRRAGKTRRQMMNLLLAAPPSAYVKKWAARRGVDPFAMRSDMIAIAEQTTMGWQEG